MATRVVEGKKPYTGGKAISIDENKVISLNLRDENNLIIYDAGDDEIYVDLQLDDEITPTSAFPIGVNVGRVIVDNGWDKPGTIISAETTSGDNIKIFYADEGTLWIDNGTGTFKQIYFKSDVDAIVATLSSYINTRTFYLGDDTDTTTAKSAVDWYLDGKNPVISQAGVLYYCASFDSHHFMTFRSFKYYPETGTYSKTLKEDRIVFALDSDNEVTGITISEDDILEVPIHSELVITLTSAGWTNNVQTVTATGVTATNSVIISPVPSNISDYTSAGIYCSAQGTDSLTFSCSTTPSTDIAVNVMIIN